MMSRNSKRFLCRFCRSADLTCRHVPLYRNKYVVAFDCMACGLSDVVHFGRRRDRKRARGLLAGRRRTA